MRFLLLNRYLKISSKSLVDMENIRYRVVTGRISKEFLHKIFEIYLDEAPESEAMKLKIYKVISENSLVSV